MKRFSADVYTSRRRTLMNTFGAGDLLLLPGNTYSPKNYLDNYYRFRQDSTFLYYAGIDLPDMAMTMDCATGKCTLYGKDVTVEDIVWTGWQPSLGSLAEEIGAEEPAKIENLASDLQRAQQVGQKIHFLPTYRGETTLLLASGLQKSAAEVERGHSAQLIQAVIAQREIKEDRELAEIEKALEISRAAHVEIIYACVPGIREADIVGVVQKVVESSQVQLAYPPIVTINGDILHNHYYGNELKEGDLLLCDVGAESISHYASDITRTYPVSLKYNAQQREIYDLVLAMLNYSTAALKPGIPYKEMHLGAARIMINGLIGMGLMKGDAEEALSSGAGALFFPHGLGHMMGFDVHDMEGLGEEFVGYGAGFARSEQFGLRSLRLGKRLEAGHVLTVEPGIYFIEKLIDQWEEAKMHDDFINYSNVRKFVGMGGIRLEDNYVIEGEGGRLLGSPIPIEPEEIEFLRGTTQNFGGGSEL